MQRGWETHPADTAQPSAPQSLFPSDPQLRQLFDFIEANYHQPISLCDVAQAVGYSPAYLTSLVRRQTGQTVNHWIVLRRMAATHALRLETNRYFQAEGISIGSGAIESTVKQIGARIKLSGAQWKAGNVPQVLLHRCAYLNGKFSN